MKKTFLMRILLLLSAALLSAFFAVPSFAEEKDDTYWQKVSDVQRDIRMSKTVKYGMTPVYGIAVKDGTYEIDAWSNSTYFKIAKAVLTAKGGVMTAEITIPSMSYLNVFPGTAAKAKAAPESEWIGFKEVDGQTVFTIPVAALNQELPCASLSKARQRWYDRLLVFDASSLPEDALLLEIPDYDLIEDAIKAYNSGEKTESTVPSAAEPETEETAEDLFEGTPEPLSLDLPDGEYSIEVNMTGGSGRASISSPTWLYIRGGKAYARLLWSSAYYDYMIIGDQTFYNLTKDGGNSVFEIPVAVMDESLPVIADTTAMGDPVEIRYELTFYSETIGPKNRIPQEAAIRVLIIAAVILVVGAVLNVLIKRKWKKKA